MSAFKGKRVVLQVENKEIRPCQGWLPREIDDRTEICRMTRRYLGKEKVQHSGREERHTQKPCGRKEHHTLKELY